MHYNVIILLVHLNSTKSYPLVILHVFIDLSIDCTQTIKASLISFFLSFEQNFAAQYDGAKGPDPGPGPMVRLFENKCSATPFIHTFYT